MYFVRSGSDPVRSLLPDERFFEGAGSGAEGAGPSSEINGRPAKARGAESLDRIFSKVL
jgi:hypothetical protein